MIFNTQGFSALCLASIQASVFLTTSVPSVVALPLPSPGQSLELPPTPSPNTDVLFPSLNSEISPQFSRYFL